MSPAPANPSELLDARALTGRSSHHVQVLPGTHLRVHPALLAPLEAMRSAAAAAGIRLEPVSAFRDFEQQRAIWNAKFSGARVLLGADGVPLSPRPQNEEDLIEAILLWSALPGASRHHWGTDLDVIDRAALAPGAAPQLTRAEFAADGPFARLERWLAAHSEQFGFFRPYDLDRGGVQPEPWHLSFAELAAPALQALTVEMLREALAGVELGGSATVLRKLPDIHARYVRAVAAPSRAATRS
jgi:LAS superfamily LD-carboxypeptidase LdcB